MPLDLDRYRLFIVDMDDTLYEERDFVFSGFRAVAEYIGERGGDPENAWQYLRQHFAMHGRDRIFDHLLCDLMGDQGIDADVAACVSVYRQHQPCIALYPQAKRVLDALRKRGRIVVLTDGLPEVQKRKFKALGLESLVDQLICCWEHAPKPDPRSLAGIVKARQPDALYIGDDPIRDLPLAEALGIDCIRVISGRFAEMPSAPCCPLAEINGFGALALAI